MLLRTLSATVALAALAALAVSCDRASRAPAPVAQAGAAGTSQAPSRAVSEKERERARRARPYDIATERVKDQLRAVALDSAHCLAPRAIRCGPLQVVRSFDVDSAMIRGDTAVMVVHYDVIGQLQPRDTTPVFVQQPGDSAGHTVVDTLVAVHDSIGWWYASGAAAHRVSAVLVALYFELPHDDMERLTDSALLSSSDVRRPVLTAPRVLSFLPMAVRDTLERRGCLIPQDRGDSTRNTAQGAFFEPGGNDWAVLCARGDTGQLLVFRGGAGAPAAALPTILAGVPNLSRLPNPFAETGGYGCLGSIYHEGPQSARKWVVTGVTAELEHTELTAEERRMPVHDAIGDGDCEGLSNLHYWTGKRWVRLPGAD